MKKRNVDEVLKYAIQDDNTLSYELKSEMWNNIERKVVATRMSNRNRASRGFSNTLVGVGTVAVVACVAFIGGHYFSNHPSTPSTTTSHPPATTTAQYNFSAATTSSNSVSPSTQDGTSPTTTPSNVVVHSYASASQATAAIDAIQQGFGQVYPSGPNVNLGNGISAEEAGAVGSLYLRWTEGRWTILANLASSDALPQAKQMVSYLHTHMLPAPQNKGVIGVAQSYNSSSPTINTITTVAWQVGTKVYEIQQTGNPISALQAAVNHG